MLLDCLHVGSKGTLEVEQVSSIGPNYVKALRLWREAFVKSWVDGKSSSYNDTAVEFTAADLEAFRRKWQVRTLLAEICAFRGFVLIIFFCIYLFFAARGRGIN